MKRAWVLLNHALTSDQLAELSATYGCRDVRYAPESLASSWADVDPADELPNAVVTAALQWLSDEPVSGDVVVVQGDPGASCYIAGFCAAKGLLPVYATTWRVAEEEPLGENSVQRRSVFRHVRFRSYAFWEASET